MPLEAILRIKAAEDEALEAKRRAEENARNAIDEVIQDGEARVAAAIARAQSLSSQLKRTAEKKAAASAVDLASTTANRQAAIGARAQARLENAAKLIAERIMDV